jgi:hypothetical protein
VAVDAAERLKDENGSCIQDAAVKAAPGPLSASFRSTHSLGDCEPLPLPSEDGRSEAVNEKRTRLAKPGIGLDSAS